MTTGRMQFLSQSMNRLADFSFILADKAMPEKGPAKNLYLLHGLTGTDTDWLWGGGNAHQIAKEFHLNIFMPTCGNTFYLDLPGNGNAYCSYIGKEFVRYTQQIFHLSSAREDNLIGGFSMGGYGALHAALSYPDSFSRAAVLSAASPPRGAFLFEAFGRFLRGRSYSRGRMPAKAGRCSAQAVYGLRHRGFFASRQPGISDFLLCTHGRFPI